MGRQRGSGGDDETGHGDDGPIVTFGVISDIQYADIDDRPAAYDASKTRYYRSSLQHLDEAVRTWTHPSNGQKPSVVLELGDLIDGVNAFKGLDSLQAMRTVQQRFGDSIPVLPVVGNHELYNFKRHQLVALLRQHMSAQGIEVRNPDFEHFYYSYSPSPGVKFIALDCYEISTLGYEIGGCHRNCTRAAAILHQKHGCTDYELWDTSGKLQGLEQRYQMQNGAISQKQLRWLDAELNESDSRKEQAIVFGHDCLLPESCDPTCLLWNYDDVIRCFSKHPSVTMYLAGHAHRAGHGKDAAGVHYLVLNGVIETAAASESFSTVTIYPDRLLVEGQGTELSLSIHLKDHYASCG